VRVAALKLTLLVLASKLNQHESPARPISLEAIGIAPMNGPLSIDSSCTLAQERGKVKHEPRVTSVSLWRTSKQKASHLTGFFIVLLTIRRF